MFNFICRNFPNLRYATKISPTHKLNFIQINTLSSSSSSSSKTLKTPTSKASDESTKFTVCYLINTYGFSPEKAISASKYVNFDNPEKPQSVFDFFTQNGFTKTQIFTLVKKLPRVLQCNPHTVFLPKFEFFTSKGIPSSDVAKMVLKTPMLLRRSLKNHIIPTFDHFKNLLKSEENAILAIKRYGMLLIYNRNTNLVPNIQILRDFGVLESNIVHLLTNQPRAFMICPKNFKEIVEEVKKLGFNPRKWIFVSAIHAFRATSRATRDRKVKVYKKWGWSEDDVMAAFCKHPGILMKSEEKIEKIMDFIINQMGWDISVVARSPVIISLSLETRIIPRCLVYKFLLSKGLIKKDAISPTSVLMLSKTCFLERILNRFEEEAPEVNKIYNAKYTSEYLGYEN